jgi:hypothetical protein
LTTVTALIAMIFLITVLLLSGCHSTVSVEETGTQEHGSDEIDATSTNSGSTSKETVEATATEPGSVAGVEPGTETEAVKEPVTEPETTTPATDPETTAPATDPETTTPATDPETPAPATDPETPAPATDPETPAPATEPETPAPATEPETTAPATEPETTAPATEPETTTPATEPETTEPVTEPVTDPSNEKPSEPDVNQVWDQLVQSQTTTVSQVSIFGVADVFSSVIEDQDYAEAWDSQTVQAFLEFLAEYNISFESATISTEEIAKDLARSYEVIFSTADEEEALSVYVGISGLLYIDGAETYRSTTAINSITFLQFVGLL